MASPVVPLRPLGVAELLDFAVRVARANARTVLTFAVPLAIVHSLIDAAGQYATIGASRSAAFADILLQLLVTALFTTLLAGLLTPVCTGALLGREVDAGGAWQQARGVAGRLVVLAVLVAVADDLGLVLLVVGGVWLWGIWAVAAPALVAERTTTLGALARSAALVRTMFWRTWGVRALGWVLTSVLGLLLTVPFTVLASVLTGSNPFSVSSHPIDNPALYVAIQALGRIVSLAILSPVSAAIDVLLYLDLRMRREGMDLVLSSQGQAVTA